MQCPKCQAEQKIGATICTRCGLVFAKYYKYHPRPGMAPAATAQPERPPRARAPDPGVLTALLLPEAPLSGEWPGLIARAVLWGVLLAWGLMLMLSSVASNAAGTSFLHLVNLPFHEAGHVFFAPFGDFLHSLGGTLGQLLMPLICLGVLLVKTRDPFGASVCAWWFGENFLDIAPYIADARAGVMPLIGGNTGQTSPYGFHDWEFLLTETGLLRFDQTIAAAAHGVGAVLMLAALGWGAMLLWRQWQMLAARR